MQAAATPKDEAERLAALRDYEILDTEPDAELDDLVELASMLSGRPVALISLVDADRQWFKARLGVDATETPRDVAFCAHTIVGATELFEVPDSLLDARFVDNPLVTGAPHVRAYTGVKLRAANRQPLGTLCVIDSVAGSLSPGQRRGLVLLGRRVEAHLEHRRTMLELARRTRAGRGVEPLVRSRLTGELMQRLDHELARLDTEPKDRTWVVARLNGLPALRERFGSLEVAHLASNSLSLAADLVRDHEGRVEHLLGDSVLAVFRDARAAVAFARQLRRAAHLMPAMPGQAITVSVGVHSGSAQRVPVGSDDRGETTLLGEAVDVATRLQALCPDDTVVISDAALARSGPVLIEGTEEATVPGRSGPLRLHRLAP
jgi:class 3 adenylate cyclase